MVEGLDSHTSETTHLARFKRLERGENSTMQRNGRRVLVIAARQPELIARLEEGGFEVAARTRPLEGEPDEVPDVAVVFRGRLIGRNQAASLAERGTPVVEVLNGEPQSSSSAGWVRLSNRISKQDLVQIVHAVADWAQRAN
jgi:hypothetical protein